MNKVSIYTDSTGHTWILNTDGSDLVTSSKWYSYVLKLQKMDLDKARRELEELVSG